MTQNSLSNQVVDKQKILNNGFPMNLSKIVGDVATVEFFEGPEGIHKIEQIEVERLENSK